jgi:hypothetical protein
MDFSVSLLTFPLEKIRKRTIFDLILVPLIMACVLKVHTKFEDCRLNRSWDIMATILKNTVSRKTR